MIALVWRMAAMGLRMKGLESITISSPPCDRKGLCCGELIEISDQE